MNLPTRRPGVCGIAMVSCLTSAFVAQSHQVEAGVMRERKNSGVPGQIAALSKPALEMERLAFLVGTWNAIDTYEKSRFVPDGGSGSGVYQTVLGPGGFSILTDYRYTGPQGESSGHQVLTWDPKQQRYVGHVVTSRSPGCITVTGNWEGPNLVLAGEFEANGVQVRFKEVFSDIAGTTMMLRQYNSIDGAPAQLFGTTKFTRK
jgi:uncharacterized protein DUF1579